MSLFRDPFFTDAYASDPFFSDFTGLDYMANRIGQLLGATGTDTQRQIASSGSADQAGAQGGNTQVAQRGGDSVFMRGFRGVRMDLSENEKAYTIKADLPGVNKEEVNISIKDDVLTISGERSQTNEQKDEKRHLVERSYGRFSRSVRLPEDANQEQVNASMKDGVLEVTVNKKEIPPEQAPKKITVQ
ncbi:hypothetical protein HK101_008167 [Irineochytrium annulatum]|nr:hypothetical protein HK101_008167 [Irineochytrium annulatum]